MKYGTLMKMGVFVAVMGLAMQASAGPILSFDGNTSITAADNLNFGAGTVQGLIRNYTPGGTILDSSAPGYSGQSVYSVTQVENTGGTAATTLDVGSGDRTDATAGKASIWIGVDGNNPAADEAVRSIASLTWFDLDAVPAAADYISAMSLTVSSSGGISDATLRFALESGGQWYVSSDNTTAGDLTYAGGNWAALSVADASSTSLMSAAGLTYNVANTALDNITAVGIFFEGQTPNTTARSRVKLVSLEASVIPEPATLGLVAVFGGGILLLRRRFML